MTNIHNRHAWTNLLALTLLCGGCQNGSKSANAGNDDPGRHDRVEQTGKAQATEQTGKAHETMKTAGDAPVKDEAAAVTSKCAEALAGSWRIGKIVSTIAVNEPAGPRARVVVQIPNRKKSVGSIECNETGGGVLKVDFVGDPGCCGGTLSDDGRAIDWSNGTKWKKQ